MTDQATREFLTACGAAGPLVLGVEEPGTSSVSWRVFDQPFIVVGRDPGADLFLNDPRVSRRHAYLQMIAGRLFCVDLQSRTGTHWGDEPGLWGWVQPDPGVRIGPFRLRPREGIPADAPPREPGGLALPMPAPRSSDEGASLPVPVPVPVPVSRSFVQPGLPEARLEIQGEAAGSPAWRISRSLVLIGSSHACKIRLRGGGVSKVHASLLRTQSGDYAVDLLGAGGISVNGMRVRWARIEDGDEIVVASHRIRMYRSGPGSPAEAVDPAGRRGASGWRGATAGGEDFGSGIVPGNPATAEDVASVMRSMLDEFGQVQMQMADRFQESLMVVLRSFAGFHGEQMALIREELAHIRELTREQQALSEKVEGRRPVAGTPSLRLVTGESTSTPQGRAREVPAPASQPEEEAHGPSNGEGGNPEVPHDPAASRPESIRARHHIPDDLHTRIADRLAMIQSERQNRWQRLLKSLLG